MTPKVLVLGSQTFLSASPRVGIQVIAQALAEAGHEVHYVSAPSSPADLVSGVRRARFKRAWLSPQPQDIAPGLKEYVLRSPFPINRKAWFRPEQYELYSALLPSLLKELTFDLCIHDTSPTYMFMDKLTIKTTVLRLNDQPEGFSFHIPDVVTRRLLDNMRAGRYAEIWAVSSGLADYAEQYADPASVFTFPNGIDLSRFEDLGNAVPTPKTAVFVGAIEKWVDLGLLAKVAEHLDDWQFDLYGPLAATLPPVKNLAYCGMLEFAKVAPTLEHYQVGLIPFGHSELIEVMERPLKFYEYLAAGLGIASTKVGDLQTGMGAWAHYGETPTEFAQAVVSAAQDANVRRAEKQAYLSRFTWDSITAEMLGRLEQLRTVE